MNRFVSIFFFALIFISLYFIIQMSNTTNKQEEEDDSSAAIIFTRPGPKFSHHEKRKMFVYKYQKSDSELQLEQLAKHKRENSVAELLEQQQQINYPSSSSQTTVTVSSQEEDDDENQQQQQQQQQQPLSPSDLLPWRDPDDLCCRTLRQASRAILGVPSEMMNLLPTLFAYYREPQHTTIVEIGSRLGYSTNTLLDAMSYTPAAKRFATVDLEIRQPIKALYKCERICSDNADDSFIRNREFFTVEGDDLQVEIPFVKNSTTAKTGKRPIDVLFIDTLHHGAQLQMELERYPEFVDKYMIFHDVHSFKHGNENGPRGFKPFEWASGRPFPKGLHPVLKQFLLDNVEEWEEEMNNIVNNGLLVLRRRSRTGERRNFSLHVQIVAAVSKKNKNNDRSSTSVSDFELESPKIVRRVLRGIEDPNSAVAASHGLPLSANICERAFRDMYQYLRFKREDISPPCNIAMMFSRRSFAETLYQTFLRLDDDQLPIRVSLGLILSHAAAALTFGGAKKEAPAVVWTCEFSAMIAAVHGVAQAQYLPNLKLLLSGFSPKTGDLVQCPSSLSRELDAYVSTYDLVKRTKIPSKPNSLHLLLLSGNILKELLSLKPKNLRHEKLRSLIATVSHRIVVYGIRIISRRKMVEFDEMLGSANFELKVQFVEHTGFVMWENKHSYLMNYVPEAKRKWNKR